MPFPNYHSARIHNPDTYDSFSYENAKSGTGVNFVLGWKNNKSEIQSVRFDKTKWNPSEAKQWLKDNEFDKYKFEESMKESYVTFEKYLQELKLYDTLERNITGYSGLTMKDGTTLHYHLYDVDINGCGHTKLDKTGHVHRIDNWIVSPSRSTLDYHIHRIDTKDIKTEK
jgi:hypothetical protein